MLPVSRRGTNAPEPVPGESAAARKARDIEAGTGKDAGVKFCGCGPASMEDRPVWLRYFLPGFCRPLSPQL